MLALKRITFFKKAICLEINIGLDDYYWTKTILKGVWCDRCCSCYWLLPSQSPVVRESSVFHQVTIFILD